MDQSGAVAPHNATEIDGGDPAREFVLAAPGLARLHARTSVCAEPQDMLIPERRALFLGRTAEMATLRTWLSGPALVAVQHIVGGAGVGKTRLAIELCAWAEGQGWDCGFIATHAFAHLGRRQRSSPSLIVLDDMEPPIDAWPDDGWTDGPPLRIIVIARDARPILEMAEMPGTVPAEVSRPLRLCGLHANDDRIALLGHAASVAASAAGVLPCLPHGGTVLDRGEPLHLLMAGLVAPHAGLWTALSESPAALAHRLAMQERWRLERLASALGLDPCLLRHIAACVTLQSGCPLDMAGELVEEEASAMTMHLPSPCDEVADVIADALGSADCDLLGPIAPPIGAAFLINEIGRHSSATQAAIVERASRRAPVAVSDMIRRAARDNADGGATCPALQWPLCYGDRAISA